MKSRPTSKKPEPSGLFRPGMHVVAMCRLVQGDERANPDAKPWEPGWVHAELDDTGFVMQVDRLGLPTVHFPRTGTDVLCFPHEIRILSNP